jgi:hypothetical protein
MLPDDFAHLFGAIGISRDSSNKRSIASCHLLAISQVSRARNVACVDRISDNDIQSLLGRRCSETPERVSNEQSDASSDRENEHGVTRIQETLSTPHREQGVFFYAQISQSIKISAIPREVCVSITKTRHKCPPSAMDNTHSRLFLDGLDIGNDTDRCYLFTYCNHVSTRSIWVDRRFANSHKPLIKTSPLYGSAPVESKMFTSRNRILDSAWVPSIWYSVGCRLSANLTASIVSMLRGLPLYLVAPTSVDVDQGTAGSSRAGDMFRQGFRVRQRNEL